MRTVQIERYRHKIYIRAEVVDIGELIETPCVSGAEISVEFPLFEVACFNLKKGHAYLKLENSAGKCLALRDLTSDKRGWTSGAVYNAVLTDKDVRSVIRNMFNTEWGKEIPFSSSELYIGEMRMLTMFIGFDRDFYSAIPFKNGTFKIDGSFKSRARKMRYADNAVSLYAASQLPNIKSVKRLFFGNAGLFFYLEESERLWQILKDPNYFVTLLSDKEIYRILADLHTRPMIFEFIRDYAATGRKGHLLKLIHRYWRAVCKYAINYGSMTAYMRESERKKWLNHQNGSVIGSFPDFAIPVCKPDERIRNCVIDGFEFSWLKTSADYVEAGRELNNCLKYWSSSDYPIMSVRKGGKIIAALEVRKGFVFQAFTSDNDSLQKVSGLPEVYSKWCLKNRLSEKYISVRQNDNEDIYILDDEDGLPF